MNTHRRYCRRWLAVLLMAVAAGTAASDEDGIAESMRRIDAVVPCRDIAPDHKRFSLEPRSQSAARAAVGPVNRIPSMCAMRSTPLVD